MNPFAFLRRRRPPPARSLYRPSWAGPGWAPAPLHFDTVWRAQSRGGLSHLDHAQITAANGYATAERRKQAHADLVRVQCGWCGHEQWHWTQSCWIGARKKYGVAGALGGDSVCTWCGRGIYAWWTPWTRFLEWADDSSREIHANGSSAGNYHEEGDEPSREWVRDLDGSVESTIYIQRDDRPHPCASGNHQLGWSCFGYGTDAPGAVVTWCCIRPGCGQGLKYGLHADGPSGPVMPRPTPEQEAEWTAWSAAKRVEDDRKRAEWIAQEVDGECNARWEGGRCTRTPGHEGAHGQEIAPGMVLAPFDEAAP